MALALTLLLLACGSDDAAAPATPGQTDTTTTDTTQAQDTTATDTVVSKTPETVTMVTYNVESGGATISGIIEAMERVEDAAGQIDIWALQEVEAPWVTRLTSHLGSQFVDVLGSTGSTDRLCVLLNSAKYEVLEQREFHDMNPGGRVRAPLMVRLRQKSDGDELLVVVNHLYRSSSSGRQEQAQKLNEWVQTISTPVVLTGDFNFDYDIATGVGNQSYDLFVAGGHVQWIKPQTLLKTQCSPRYNSILDFFFVNDDASQWQATSSVISWSGDCSSSATYPDHRPILARFTF